MKTRGDVGFKFQQCGPRLTDFTSSTKYHTFRWTCFLWWGLGVVLFFYFRAAEQLFFYIVFNCLGFCRGRPDVYPETENKKERKESEFLTWTWHLARFCCVRLEGN